MSSSSSQQLKSSGQPSKLLLSNVQQQQQQQQNMFLSNSSSVMLLADNKTTSVTSSVASPLLASLSQVNSLGSIIGLLLSPSMASAITPSSNINSDMSSLSKSLSSAASQVYSTTAIKHDQQHSPVDVGYVTETVITTEADDTGNEGQYSDGEIKDENTNYMRNSSSADSKLPPKSERRCGVCGDVALGCNFDAISCESCKAFFRRNAFKEASMKCLFDGNCKIDVNTRRFCPCCRIKKCFLIGMKKELILGDDEKKRRLEKVSQNRVKKVKREPQCKSPMPCNVEDNTQSSVSIEPLMMMASPGAEPIEVQPLVIPAELSSLFPYQQLLEASGLMATNTSTTSSQNSSIEEAQASGPLTVDNTNILTCLKMASSKGFALRVTSLDHFSMRKLSGDETALLQELTQVYDLSFTVDLEPLIHIKQLDPSLNQLINQSSITVLRIIKFAKRLEEFVRLPQECQIGILKGSCIHILLLRSVSLYDCDRDVWVTPRGDIPTEILKNATGFVKLHDDHVRYCKSMKCNIGNDLTIVVILLVIVLFSPDGPHVTLREVVSNIQDKYLILLKHYLESKYTFVKAAEMFPILMTKLQELNELADYHGKYLLDINPRDIEPIMLEILDLK